MRATSGTARAAPGRDYAATAFVPPLTVDTGLASFVIRPATLGAWRCAADAGWLVGSYRYPHDVDCGDVIVVREGPAVVGYFHVAVIGAAKVDRGFGQVIDGGQGDSTPDPQGHNLGANGSHSLRGVAPTWSGSLCAKLGGVPIL